MKNYAIAGLLFHIGVVFSLPISPEVLVGNAEFLLEGRELSIQVSEQSQIHWNDFSIDAGERVSFIQPSDISLVVNRVIGDQQSQILGQIKANGQVILINQNGVLFGKEARIDTQSFIASTLDLQGDCFARNKKLIFEGTSTAPILNFGSIAARNIGLISADIDNRGTLEGLDSVALIGSTYHSAWECQFGQPGSRIAQSGRIASPGGSVHLMADEIFVFGTSEITTSHPFGGGEILIGSALQGNDPSFPIAKTVWVDEGAHFFADAWEQGTGGTVVLFSKDITAFAGHISAQGGSFSGDGGFAEVSGGELSFFGSVDLKADRGNTGTILLDPTNIIIDTVLAGTFATPPIGAFATPCGNVVPASTAIQSTSGTTTITATAGTLAGLIAGGNVIIDATTGGGGGGNITWMPGGTNNFLYASINSLTLRASGTVTIRANVQNSLTGNLIISSTGPTVNINLAGNTQRVSFGSNDGLTQICAPNAVVNVIGTGILSAGAQVGFYTAATGTSTGPIAIQCASLNVISGLGGFSGARVGHGQMDVLFPGVVTSTTANAVIDVTALGNISITALGIAADARIGHGSRLKTVGGGALAGNITVTSTNGDLLLQQFATSNYTGIGHGFSLSGSPPTDIAGDILVMVPNGNIAMQYFGVGASTMVIGHGLTASVLDGDVEVCCGGDLTMDGNPLNGLEQIFIGHSMFVGAPAYNGLTLVTVGRDIRLTGGILAVTTGNMTIGLFGVMSAPFILRTEIACGGNFRATNRGISMNFGNTSCPAGSDTMTFLMAGGDIILDSPISRGFGISACGNVAVAAGGNFIATNGPPGLGGAALIASTQNVPILSSTRIYARGNLLGTNGPGQITNLGNFGPANYFVDFRAGGDIQIPSSYPGIGTGGLFIEADTILSTGQMWNYTGSQITSVCGLPCTPFPINCPNLLTGATAAPSPPVFPDALGAVRFETAPFAPPFLLLITSTSGPITIHSASRRINGFIQDLRIGTVLGLDNVNITTTSGNIEIFGTQIPGQCQGCPNPILGPCRSPDSFYNVTLNKTLTTTGSVFISANNDLMLTALGNIDTSGGPSPVTLICDNQAPIRSLIGPGRFIMDSASFITTGAAQLRIHTALQGANIWGIGARLNNLIFGTDWTLGTLYICTNQEIWCSYFCDLTCPMSGIPFTISYKDCLQIATAQAMVIVDQFLVDLHPYNEFPGWMVRFFVYYLPQLDEDGAVGPDEPYLLRRRNLNLLKHPKSYTVPLNNELDHSFERDVRVR